VNLSALSMVAAVIVAIAWLALRERRAAIHVNSREPYDYA
jgi:hypothetical protein